MSIASFEEEQKLVQETSGAQSQHFLGMSGWLVRKGLAANQTSADLMLAILVGGIVLLSGLLIFASRSSSQFVSVPAGVDPSVYESVGKTPANNYGPR